ncbi:MAG TPA: aromatic ring-hydroxylating dioxygenase subunit alpha [Alphaproteobacteria bacterium]|nr:aromatic ring-hydroxylating dioxygenase subunit alpha [Alphaproteobacteria bacterium]
MSREQRIAIARRILELVEKDEPEYGEESWETDIGRFVDKERFELEKRKFFLERPQLIAYSADIPDPGDYYTTEIAGRPIILTRDKDGKAHAFLNACRHRGVKLAEGCGHAKGFTCPYHGWTYGIDGELLSVPSRMAFEEAQLRDRNLIALPLAEKMGLILVHPQPGGAIDFDEFMGPLGEFLSDFNFDKLRFIAEYRAPAQINWKHAVDGGVEGYHVPFLHPETVGPLTLKQFLHLDFGMHQTLISPQKDIVNLKGVPESEWPDFPPFGLTHAVFPNTVIGGGGKAGGIAFFQRSEPGDKPGVCTYIFRTYGVGRDPAPEIAEAQQYMSDLLMRTALDEDMKVQSNAQIMMETGVVSSIIFGRREANMIKMHKNYDRLIGHDAATALKGLPLAAE